MGEDRGPFTDDELRHLAHNGEIFSDMFVKRSRQGEWRLACNVEGLFTNQNLQSLNLRWQVPHLKSLCARGSRERMSDDVFNRPVSAAFGFRTDLPPIIN